MKTILLCILTLLIGTSIFGQELQIIKDSINHFEIGVPIGWKYGIPTNKSLAFMAFRQKLNEQDIPRENFNINILHKDEKDLEKSFNQFQESIGKAEGFKIIKLGDTISSNRKYKYIIETHKNKISKEDMHNYVFFTNNNGEILILTMVTTSSNFEKFKGLFSLIAKSLKY
jgi:hypothetical protein